MSTTPKQESTHISPSEDSKVPLQENQTLLQIKRERDEADEQRCQECGLEDKDKILSFALSNKLMTFIYENVLNPGIDNQTKNEILALALPNKAINLKICKNCLIKTLVTKGLNYLIDIPPSSEQDNKTNNGIPCNEIFNNSDKSKKYDSFYKVYWNYFIKQIEMINESISKNSTELEQILNKMALHLIINKETAQFQKFNTEMGACKSLLMKDKDAFNELLKNMKKNDEMFGDLAKIIDKKIMNNINDEKMNQLLSLINQIQNEGEALSSNEPDKAKKSEIKIGEGLAQESPRIVAILNQTNNIGDSVSIGDTDNIVSSYSLNEFQVQSQPKISIETGAKATKKKNYIIKSMNPIHEITPSIPLNSNNNTPITQMGVKPIEQTPNPLLPNAVNPQGALLTELQMKMNPTKAMPNPLQPVMPNFGPQIPQNPLQLQMLQHSMSPQMGIPPQRVFPPMYDPNLFNPNAEAINALMMKNMFPPQAENKISPQNVINMYQPNPLFPGGMNFPHPYLDISQFLMQQQQEKIGQKMNLPPNMGGMPNYPPMPPQRMDNFYDPQQGGMNNNMNNCMNLRNSFNEMAKQKDPKPKQYQAPMQPMPNMPNMGNNGENKTN